MMVHTRRVSPCPNCPVAKLTTAHADCLGMVHRPVCTDVANGLAGRAAQLVEIATESPDQAVILLALDVAVDVCVYGQSGACGCDPLGPPRTCTRVDRPRKVLRSWCYSCQTGKWATGAAAPATLA